MEEPQTIDELKRVIRELRDANEFLTNGQASVSVAYLAMRLNRVEDVTIRQFNKDIAGLRTELAQSRTYAETLERRLAKKIREMDDVLHELRFPESKGAGDADGK